MEPATYNSTSTKYLQVKTTSVCVTWTRKTTTDCFSQDTTDTTESKLHVSWTETVLLDWIGLEEEEDDENKEVDEEEDEEEFNEE